MMDVKLFGNELKRLGFELFTGVPCSFLKDLINFAINESCYVPAVNEGDAVAIAAGASVGGKKSVVLMQNSGLTNAISPLTSLNNPFRIPVLGFVSLRGEQGIPDEPQHELMGRITEDMLKIMGINYGYLSQEYGEARSQLEKAVECFESNQSYFFIVRKDTFKTEPLHGEQKLKSQNVSKSSRIHENLLPTRYEALQVINSLKDKNTVQIPTTGMTGRELYDIEDSDNNFYMVGSMGCAGSFGLGLALARKEKDIVVIDGDGALLMRMGCMAVIGSCRPSNMLHILLDNCSYDSTGGQNTVSDNIDFVGIAASCGYAYSVYCHNNMELEDYIKEWKRKKQLMFIHIKISAGSKEGVGRPKMKPYEVKERLKVFIDG